jgi:hypothetical protein
MSTSGRKSIGKLLRNQSFSADKIKQSTDGFREGKSRSFDCPEELEFSIQNDNFETEFDAV